MSRRVMRREEVLLFTALAALLGLVTLWLLQNHFSNEAALKLWATVVAVLDGSGARLTHLGFEFPHGLFLVLAPFHYLGPLGSETTPYLVTVLFAAALMVLWNRHLREAGNGVAFRGLLLVLMLFHPALLWNATGGTLGSLSLLLFYILYMAALRMATRRDIHSFILVGLGLASLLFVNQTSLYLFLALTPLLVLLVPRNILMTAPLSAYVILVTPLMVLIVSWLYFNFIFYGSPFAFLHDPQSGFLGGRQNIEQLPWLLAYGGEWLRPAGWSALFTLAAFPVLLLLGGDSSRHPAHFSSAMILWLFPAVAVALASYALYLQHPLQIVSLVAAGVMAELTMLDTRRRLIRGLAVVLLGLGVAGGWYGFMFAATPPMQQWSVAMQGEAEAGEHDADRALGEWLDRYRAPTLIDGRSAYRAIVARGDARELILPASDEFKMALRRGRPGVALIAVPDPASIRGRRDALNQRWPMLYEQGFEGYRLDYDGPGWRVWGRDE